METIKKVDISTAMWRTKNGEIPVTELTNDHLQNALNYSEQAFIRHHNNSISFVSKIESLEKQSEDAFKSSEIFHNLIKALITEGKRRGITIESIADRTPEKYDILRKDPIYTLNEEIV